MFGGDKGGVQKDSDIWGVVTVKDQVDKKLIDCLPNLKIVAVAFTGYDCVDMKSCQERGLAVYNVPAYSTDSVAEFTVALAISLLREIPRADNFVRSGKWDLGKAGLELSGRTIGICGTGTIGLSVAGLFKAFKTNIIGWSRKERREFKAIGEYVPTIKDLCAGADILTVHVPLMPETRGLIGQAEFAKMKPTSYLINTARGPIVDETALAHALQAKQIAGAAIDVYDQEPVSPDSPLLKAPNTILAPHIAYKTEEALRRRAQTTVDNIVNFINGKTKNRVDI